MGAFVDLMGQRFGSLTALRYTHIVLSSGRRMPAWVCACDCGAEKAILGCHLRSGKSRSCGCRLGSEKPGGNRKKWPGYGVWQQMNYRCENPDVKGYRYYGARGIKVCDRWRGGVDGFENFIADMGGPPPDGLTIDRIDNDGNYEPGNCRWATPEQQRFNTRRSIHAVIGGVRVPLIKYAKRLGLNYEVLRIKVRKDGIHVTLAARLVRQYWRAHRRAA